MPIFKSTQVFTILKCQWNQSVSTWETHSAMTLSGPAPLKLNFPGIIDLYPIIPSANQNVSHRFIHEFDLRTKEIPWGCLSWREMEGKLFLETQSLWLWLKPLLGSRRSELKWCPDVSSNLKLRLEMGSLVSIHPACAQHSWYVLSQTNSKQTNKKSERKLL